MFKLKHSILLISLCIVSLMGCDGKERATKTNTENVIESKLPDSFFVQEKYFPESYSEKITDTILSNGFKVRIKMFSDMDKSVLNDFKIDSIHYKHYYRDFKASIIILKDENEVFNKIIDKVFFQDIYNSERSYFKNATLRYVKLDELVSTFGEKIIIDFSFVKATESFSPTYRVSINKNGKYQVELKKSS